MACKLVLVTRCYSRSCLLHNDTADVLRSRCTSTANMRIYCCVSYHGRDDMSCRQRVTCIEGCGKSWKVCGSHAHMCIGVVGLECGNHGWAHVHRIFCLNNDITGPAVHLRCSPRTRVEVQNRQMLHNQRHLISRYSSWITAPPAPYDPRQMDSGMQTAISISNLQQNMQLE